MGNIFNSSKKIKKTKSNANNKFSDNDYNKILPTKNNTSPTKNNTSPTKNNTSTNDKTSPTKNNTSTIDKTSPTKNNTSTIDKTSPTGNKNSHSHRTNHNVYINTSHPSIANRTRYNTRSRRSGFGPH